MRNVRENLLISSIVCITAGAFFTVAGIMSIAGTIGISGVVLFILGMSVSSQQGMSKKEIEEWVPESSQMPDAGRVMYRVDVTIDEPKNVQLCAVHAAISKYWMEKDPHNSHVLLAQSFFGMKRSNRLRRF